MKELFELGSPSFFLTTVETSDFRNLYLRFLREHHKSAVRMIRGSKCQTLNTFFDEVSAVFQFPYYFGYNGAAFRDCILDLDWLDAEAYLLMIDDCDLLLKDSPDDHFLSMMDIFVEANREWLEPNKYIPRNRKPTPFHIFFRCEQKSIVGFCKRLDHLKNELQVMTVL